MKIYKARLFFYSGIEARVLIDVRLVTLHVFIQRVCVDLYRIPRKVLYYIVIPHCSKPI